MGEGKQDQGFLGIRLKIWFSAVTMLSICVLLICLTDAARNPVTEPPLHSFAGAALTSTTSHFNRSPSPQQHDNAPSQTPLSWREAAFLAATLANAKAQELYDCVPFTPESATIQLSDSGAWEWIAKRGRGKADFAAVVRLQADGTAEEVDVLFLESTTGL